MAKKKQKKQQSVPAKKIKTIEKSPSYFHNQGLHILLLFAFGCLLYANTLTHQFALDDAIVIYDNEFTTQGVSGIDDLFKHDTFRGFFKEEGKKQLVTGGRYRPLTPAMFALEWNIAKDSPGFHHFINILLYAGTGILIYLLFFKLLSNHKKELALFVAFFTAAIFLAHPVHTEAVANIKGRDEIMALLLSLGTLYLSWLAIEKNKSSLLIWAAGIFFLALLSKENAITFLAVIPLTFFVFTKNKFTNWTKIALPTLGATFLFLGIRSWALGGFDMGNAPIELMNNPFVKISGGQYIHAPFGEKMATIFYTLGEYLRLLVIPHPLTHDYYPRHIELMSWGNWKVLLSLVLHLGMGIWAVLNIPKKNLIAYGILFYLLTLSIVSNIVFPVGTNMSERFIYMPSLGFCFVAALLVYRFGESQSKLKLAGIALGIIMLLFSIKTVTRNAAWEDNFTLFTTDIKVSKNSAKLLNAVGGELLAQAAKPENASKKEAMALEAKGHLTKALSIHPNYKNAYLLLGNSHYFLKDYSQAESSYNQALGLDPNFPDAIRNKALVHEELGKKYGSQGDHPRAIKYFEQVVNINPENAKVWFFLGSSQRMSGNPQAAIKSFQQALARAADRENDIRIFNEIAQAYQALGNETKAQEYLAKTR